MTTVRMSAKVVDKILENAATAFIKANPLKQYEETLGDRIYDSALVNVIPIFQQISKLDEIDSNSVLDNNSYIDVSIDGIHTNEYPDPGGSDFSYRPKLTSHYSSIRVPTSTQKLYFSHQNNVEIFEAGKPSDIWKVNMPLAILYTMHDPKYNYKYYSEPEPHLHNRRLFCPRGKMIGGCSAHNGMVFVR